MDKNNKILKQVNNLLIPLRDELAVCWKEKRKVNPEAHEHGVCILQQSLRLLAAAVKYNAEADLNFNLIKAAIARIKKQVTAQESVAIISCIEGVMNAYSSVTGLVSLAPKSDMRISSGELLIELLEDADYIALSKARYLLGIPATAKKSVIEIKRFIRRIITDKQKQSRLASVRQVVNIATDTLSIPIKVPDIPPTTVAFAPPLVTLDDLRNPCMRHRFMKL